MSGGCWWFHGAASRSSRRRWGCCSSQVTPQQSLALVEYIAHLSVQDWNAVTGDLQRLGACPSGLDDAVHNQSKAGSGLIVR